MNSFLKKQLKRLCQGLHIAILMLCLLLAQGCNKSVWSVFSPKNQASFPEDAMQILIDNFLYREWNSPGQRIEVYYISTIDGLLIQQLKDDNDIIHYPQLKNYIKYVGGYESMEDYSSIYLSKYISSLKCVISVNYPGIYSCRGAPLSLFMTKVAGDGFVWVNANVSAYIRQHAFDTEKVVYYLNGKYVKRRSADSLVRLKRAKLQQFKIENDSATNTLSVYITTRSKK